MKKVLFAALMSISFFACKKDSTEPTPTPVSTSLVLTLTNSLGNSVSGANVKLYSTLSDWENQTNQVGSSQTSDVNGKVIFDNLSATKYYWFAEKNCINNVNSSITSQNALIANQANTFSSILNETGDLILNNTSTNPYRIYINGTEVFDMNGGTTETIRYLSVGSYSIRVLQLSGFIFTPTDQTYTGDINCGGTLTTTFP